jgi:hypothetical protein
MEAVRTKDAQGLLRGQPGPSGDAVQGSKADFVSPPPCLIGASGPLFYFTVTTSDIFGWMRHRTVKVPA